MNIYVCCECEPDVKLDNKALVLVNRICDKHGNCWHREMVRHDDGSLELAIPLSTVGRANNPTEPPIAEGWLGEHIRIHRLLQADIGEAKKRMDAASESFLSVMCDIPSHLPHPDGTQRIHNVSREYSAACERMSAAQARLSNFLMTGLVPDDVKKSG